MDRLTEGGVRRVFLPSEPFPFKEEHRSECTGMKATLVDGEMFSWYGSRMRHVPAYMRALSAAEG